MLGVVPEYCMSVFRLTLDEKYEISIISDIIRRQATSHVYNLLNGMAMTL
jgi:hypothetical protein